MVIHAASSIVVCVCSRLMRVECVVRNINAIKIVNATRSNKCSMNASLHAPHIQVNVGLQNVPTNAGLCIILMLDTK